MKVVFRVGLPALALLVLWADVVFVGTSEGQPHDGAMSLHPRYSSS